MSAWSPANMMKPMPSWRRLLVHLMRWALALALASAGKSIAAKMAMMAMTTNNSIRVKARFIRRCGSEFINQNEYGSLNGDSTVSEDVFFSGGRRGKFD